MRRMNFGTPVLVIDDDPNFVEVMEEMLHAAGYATAVARNAFHGLKLARELKPAAIVCDVTMPDMTGLDLLRVLAFDPALAQIPRVLVSGRGDVDVSFANAFLQKPFQPAELLAVIKSASRLPEAVLVERSSEAISWQG